MKKKMLPVIGWREWASLPDLKISSIKIKTDTGATTSALHADNIQIKRSGRKKFVHFVVHPIQASLKTEVHCKAEMIEQRLVKCSNGQKSLRPVIESFIKIGEFSWPIEITLVNRDVMGFRMLLGRQAIADRFLVNPSHSFLIGKRRAKRKKSTKAKKKTSF